MLGVLRVPITIRLAVEFSIALAAIICVIGICAQGRLKHVLLWLLGAVPRKRPSFSTRVPRAEHHWALIGSLSADAREEPQSPPT
ncbi:MAG TPA: hypothetical protein VF362_01635 [Demequinaceae bacterium]